MGTFNVATCLSASHHFITNFDGIFEGIKGSCEPLANFGYIETRQVGPHCVMYFSGFILTFKRGPHHLFADQSAVMCHGGLFVTARPVGPLFFSSFKPFS